MHANKIILEQLEKLRLTWDEPIVYQSQNIGLYEAAIKKLEESVNITLEYQNTSDPRKDIFNYAVEKEWILTEMTLTRKNLEDIFRNLTGQGA